MNDIKSMTPDELSAYISKFDEPPYRAKQLYDWMHVKLVKDTEQMSNIGKSLKEKLSKDAYINTLDVVKVCTSKEDGTQKYLFKARDGGLIETVKMVYNYGISVCVSSQIGCRMGCRFCASTVEGLDRSLLPSEIIDQVYRIQSDSKERVSHVVIMGMGEPFDNYDAVIKAIRLLTDKNGLNISARNITLSTCGIVPGIKRFADEGLNVTLALSLHASNQKTRQELLPVAKVYDIDEVLGACDYYFKKTGRRVTYEYSLVSGVNDRDENAKELAQLIRGRGHINLIPVNPVDGLGIEGTDARGALRFKNKLEKYGINVTIRRETGRDIDGACGQLRRRNLSRKE